MGGTGSGRKKQSAAIMGLPPRVAPPVQSDAGPTGRLVSSGAAEVVPPRPADEVRGEKAAKLDALAGEAATRATEEIPKRKHQRKVPVPPVDEATQKRMDDAKRSFSQFTGVALDILAPRLPNPIPITEGEKNVMAEATSAMIEKYFPLLGGYDVELAFTAAILLVFVPRMFNPNKKKPAPVLSVVPPAPERKVEEDAKKSNLGVREDGERKDAADEKNHSAFPTGSSI